MAAVCAGHGVEVAVLSPGSRCAPLTIGFVRHPLIRTLTISDERVAGFVALGWAQATAKPVVLVCTSGTAAQQYGAAIAEAFYQQTPLIVMTADRPPEWWDQADGQTIRQQQLHRNHVKATYDLPASYAHPDEVWQINRQTNEALLEAQRFPPGPVHLNVPIREPFYPDEGQALGFGAVRLIREQAPATALPTAAIAQWESELASLANILIVPGQMHQEAAATAEAAALWPAPVLADVISNAQQPSQVITMQDWFLANALPQPQALQPDLLITYGRSVISKNTKLFLRKNPPKAHWHISEAGYVPDTFQSLTHIIRASPKAFFQSLLPKPNSARQQYWEHWQKLESQTRHSLTAAIRQQEEFTEFGAVKAVLSSLPPNAHLHLANSMSVRYANFLSVKGQKATVWANRGTSGIDGCTSTAVGHALARSECTHILITGDLAFFYDRNAFWHNYLPKNLKILLLNNQGGLIFRMINGPARQPEAEEYFVTQQKLRAAHLAADYQIAHFTASAHQELVLHLPAWLEAQSCAILEVITTNQLSSTGFRQIRSELHRQLSEL